MPYSFVSLLFFFFFNDTATTEIYTLSLHDALPISSTDVQDGVGGDDQPFEIIGGGTFGGERLLIDRFAADKDRKSTRLNSSHANISYAVFCLKKKKISNT